MSICLTLTELPVLGDDLTVATVAVTRVGPKGVHTVAPAFTRAVLTLIDICEWREGEGEEGERTRETEREQTS